MNSIVTSPSAMLLVLGLIGIVLTQITGDVRQSVSRAHNNRSKAKATSYRLESDTLLAALKASKRALVEYKLRATGGTNKPAGRTGVSLPLVFGALSLVVTAVVLEGVLAGCIVILAYLVLMTVVGLLAWPTHLTENVSTKFAVALLAPFSCFMR